LTSKADAIDYRLLYECLHHMIDWLFLMRKNKFKFGLQIIENN